MKIAITEKQLKLILSNLIGGSDLYEDDTTTSTTTTDTGTSTSGDKEGYPEVGKWESGVTRGPANQVGVTKWSDIVGSSLKRGKANQLK